MPACLYTTICRQPVIDDDSKEQVFTLSNSAQFEIIVSFVLVLCKYFSWSFFFSK